MMNNFDEINLILAEMVDDGMVEPIDDPSYNVDFWDYADIVGIDVDDYIPAEYT